MSAQKKITILLSVVISFLFLTLGHISFAQTQKAKPAPPAPTYKQFNVTMYTSQFGRSSYIQGFALAEALNKHSKWLKGTAQETTGSTDNVKLGATSPATRNTSLMVVSESLFKMARDGKTPFDKPYKDLRVVGVGFRAAHFFGTLDPKIKTFQDMIGKRVGVGPKIDPHGIKGTEQLKYVYEILDKVKLVNMPAPDITDAMVDGIIDVGLLTANVGYPTWMKDESLEALSAQRNVYPIQLTVEQLKKSAGKSEITFTPIQIPANMLFPGQIPTYASVSHVYWLAYVDLPDEVVYEVLRMFHDYQPDFVAQHHAMKAIVPDLLGVGPFTKEEVHPGALKFYKDRGMKVGL
jgi:uncharacterized protein